LAERLLLEDEQFFGLEGAGVAAGLGAAEAGAGAFAAGDDAAGLGAGATLAGGAGAAGEEPLPLRVATFPPGAW